MLASNKLIPIITQPTRVTMSSHTVIDHIITNTTLSPIIPGIYKIKITDHYPTFRIMQNKPQNVMQGPVYYRDLNNMDKISFVQHFYNVLNELCITLEMYDSKELNNQSETFV